MRRVRLCACGCKADLDKLGLKATAKWASEAHATAWARANPGKSKRVAASPNVARTRKPSGPQLSYHRLVGDLRDALAHAPSARDIALESAFACLPERQRQRLEARHG